MRVLLCQLDGKLPNIALMRLSAYHKRRGDSVGLLHGAAFETSTGYPEPQRVYGSAIFRVTIPLAERLRKRFPESILGGTGIDPPRAGEIVPLSPVISRTVTSIEEYGITNRGEGYADLDYEFYPQYTASLGFTQRGCRLNCSFCCVGVKEGRMRSVQSVYGIWRGGDHPRHLHLLDNDFFGQANWQSHVRQIIDGHFKVSFNQGINARFLTDEAAEAIGSMNYRDDSMSVKRIYTAWDNLKDEHRLFDGLGRLVKYGVRPDHIMVYMLCGYWPGETQADRDYRRQRLREFGARPYPMPFVRTKELVGFQRWVIGAYDKRPEITWSRWVAADYRPEKLGLLQAESVLELQ